MKADGSKPVEKPAQPAQVKGDKVDESDPLATLNKRLKDTRDWATKVQQKNEQLEARLKVAEAKLDGSYIEPSGPSPEQQAELDRYWERVKVDSKVMAEAYGEDTLQERIFGEGSPYRALEQADPLITERLKRAERPVLEAWKILEKYEFEQKYGTEPDAIKAAIIKEYTEHQQAELAAEIKGHKPTIESVGTLAGIGGVPRDKAPQPKGGIDIKKVFPLFPQGYAQ
jgi:hypothetical protein